MDIGLIQYDHACNSQRIIKINVSIENYSSIKMELMHTLIQLNKIQV